MMRLIGIKRKRGGEIRPDSNIVKRARLDRKKGEMKMEVMQDMGMTDLQFKSWLKQIIRGLEGAKEESTKEDTDKKLEELLQDLKEDLQG